MGMIKLIVLLLVYIHPTAVSSEFVATFSKNLYPGIPFGVNVQILNATADVTVTAELLATHASLNTSLSLTQKVLQLGIPTSFKLDVPHELDLYKQYNVDYYIRISGSGGDLFTNQTELSLSSERLFIFIQTDKTRYSAGQEVKFRVFYLLPNLQNFKGNSTVTVYDGAGNRVKVLGPQKVVNGVIEYRLPLSEQLVLGAWKIAASANGVDAKKTFEIFDHAVTKFSVKLEVPRVARDKDSFTINVTARFGYNADVIGVCKLQIYNNDYTAHYVEFTKKISGSTSFNISRHTLESRLYTYNKMNVRAIVSDNATVWTMVTEEPLVFDDWSYEYEPEPYINAPLEHDRLFVPGLPYYTSVQISKGNDVIGTKGFLDVSVNVTTAEVKLCYLNNPPNEWLDVQTTQVPPFTIPFDEAGFASLILPTSSITDKINVELSYGDEARYTLDLKAFSRNTLKTMRMSTKTPRNTVGDSVTIDAQSTLPLTGIVLYEVFSRGILVRSDQVVVAQLESHHYDLTLTNEMVPSAFVRATHVTDTGTVISDYITVKVAGSDQQNKVNISINKTKFQPGEMVNITVSADPDSTVYMLVEDERNVQLGTSNDIYPWEIDNIAVGIDRHINWWSNGMRSNVGLMSDVSTSLGHDSNQGPLSDNWNSDLECFLKDPFYTLMTVSPTTIPPLIEPTEGAPMTPAHPTDYNGLELGVILRSKFPDTWLWESYPVEANGVVHINTPVPDTITSWVISTMATNPTSGFGIANKPKITVKKEILITMDLPTFIKQGEEFLLQLTVFNYSPFRQTIHLHIESTDDLNNPRLSTASVQTGEGYSTYFQFTPSSTGTFGIRASARAGLFKTYATDSLEKNVTVLPNGLHKTDNEQHLVDVGTTSAVETKTILLDRPKDLVNGTLTTTLTVTGNLLVPSINGVHNLISSPHGLGEQALIDFAPYVIIVKYLQSTGKLTDEVRSDLLSHIETGYQKIMQFRDDRSYSVFGNKNAGSAWMTAFVLRYFHQADEFLNIDDEDIEYGLDWLMGCQDVNGSFSEPGVVPDTNSPNLRLTAFVLISLLENRHVPTNTSKLDQSIQNGVQFLESTFGKGYMDGFTLSVVCYAIAKAEVYSRNACYDVLKNEALHNDDGMYWSTGSYFSNNKRSMSTSKSSAGDVQATAYNLLTYLSNLNAQTKDILSIVRWLVAQRNANGGFQSTHDTVVVLKALTDYAMSQYNHNNPWDYGVQLNAFSFRPAFQHSYSTTPATFDDVHTVELPDDLPNIILQAMGNGQAVIDVTRSYYVSNQGPTTNIYNGDLSLTVNVRDATKNSIIVQPCISWEQNQPSGLVVLEVELPTGFQPDVDQLNKEPLVKRHENIGRHVNLYLSDLPDQQRVNVCIDVKLNRRDPVINNQACYVTVYDYYAPSRQITTMYESSVLKNVNMCELCPLCTFCTANVGQIGVGK